jgi:hypothetical protein
LEAEVAAGRKTKEQAEMEALQKANQGMKMKKGGKYRVYIPWNLAYGEQMGKESLCFLIELIDYAPEGTFVKPQPAQSPTQGF